MKKIKKDNRGMTMVEVLVGFAVLALVMGSLTHVIRFSEKMMMKSVDVIDAQQKMKSEVYKITPDSQIASKVNGIRFYLTLQGDGTQLELTDAEVYCYEVEDMGVPVFRFRNK